MQHNTTLFLFLLFFGTSGNECCAKWSIVVFLPLLPINVSLSSWNQHEGPLVLNFQGRWHPHHHKSNPWLSPLWCHHSLQQGHVGKSPWEILRLLQLDWVWSCPTGEECQQGVPPNFLLETNKQTSMTMSAPAWMASSASCCLPHSTSIFSANPPTFLAFWTALVMLPVLQMWLS